MIPAYVSLGSNMQREQRIREAVTGLRRRFGEIELSPVYDTAAVGFDGSNFLNLVARFDTDLEVDDIVQAFHQIEARLGRDRSLPKFASRPIDLDLLLYGDAILDRPGIRIPRPEILHHAFVLKPLQDLAPNLRHPENGRSYAELWQEMEPTASWLELFPMDL